MRAFYRRCCIWWARRLLRGTGLLAVPIEEVKRVDALCVELGKYAEMSGALNDPHRLRAKRRIERMTTALRNAPRTWMEEDLIP